MKTLLALAMLALAVPAFAQQTKPQPARAAPKVQKIDFGDGDVLEGAIARPVGEVYVVPVRPAFGSLLKIRENFNDRLAASVHEL